MTRDELRAIMNWLRERVHLEDRGAEGEVHVGLDAPTADEIERTELNHDGLRQILAAGWWDEMVADVVETPEMCEPDDPPEQVLAYARDVVSEYIRKRASLS